MRTRTYGELRLEGPIDDARESARKPTPNGTSTPGSSPAGCARFSEGVTFRGRGHRRLGRAEQIRRALLAAHAGEVVADQLRDREDGTGHPRRLGHRRDLGRGLRRLLGARDPEDHSRSPARSSHGEPPWRRPRRTVTSVSRTADAQSNTSASG
jgi:hypothetical protein